MYEAGKISAEPSVSFEFAKTYSIQISYFEKNFYKNSRNENLKEQLNNVIAIIENLLRNPGVKNILCNKQIGFIKGCTTKLNLLRWRQRIYNYIKF